MNKSKDMPLNNEDKSDERTSISLQNITISYNNSEAVKNIFFDIVL